MTQNDELLPKWLYISQALTEFAKGMGFDIWIKANSDHPIYEIRFEDPAPGGSGQWEIISIFAHEVTDPDLTIQSICDHLIEKFGYGDGVLM